MTTQLLERPKTTLTIMHREHKELLEHLAPEAKTRVVCCAAKLIHYFDRWQSWKKTLYPTEWVYQPLQYIREELLDEHSIHVIRAAIALLQRLGFLSVRKNDRATNLRNGQDRTHQYLLHSERIELELERLFRQVTAETLAVPPFVNVEISSVSIEIPGVNVETSSITVDTDTQIPSTDSCTDSCSFSETREKMELLSQDEDEEDSQEELVDTSVASSQYLNELLQQSKNSKLDKSSAPPRRKKVQTDLPTPEGWDEFYLQLLNYARREGKSSPAGWVAVTSRDILSELAAGRQHCLWGDFEQGLPLGSSEFGGQREWLNPETQEAWTYFRAALTDHFQRKDAGRNKEVRTSFDVAGEVEAVLSQPKKAAAYWTELKKQILFYREEWERQKALGVSQPYLPTHFSDRTEPSLQEAAQAMSELKGSSEQPQLLPPQQACLSPADDSDSSPAAPPVEEEVRPPLPELQEKLNSRQFASIARVLVRLNPQWGYRVHELDLVLPVAGAPSLEYLQWLLNNTLTANKVRQLIAQNPDWGYWWDADGQLCDF